MTRLTYKQDKISEHDIAERVRLHMPLARKIAWQMHGRVRDLFEIEDLIQIGMTTLVEAAQRFQDTGEASFGTYASVRMRGALVDHLRSHLAMTRTAVQRRNRIDHAEHAVRQRGDDPTDVNIMTKELGISLAEYRTWRDQIVPVTGRSLDEIYEFGRDQRSYVRYGRTDLSNQEIRFEPFAQKYARGGLSAVSTRLNRF